MYGYLSYWIVFLSYLLFHSMACRDTEEVVPVTRETEHFILITDSELSTEGENMGVLDKAEAFYSKIRDILGEKRAPSTKITIRLEGDFVEQGPYFDTAGIHLFRYSLAEDGYYAALAHEIVHAFRVDYYIAYDPWSWPNYPSLDEGFAELIAQIIDPGKTGFPWYGYDEYAVVGDLVISGNLIPHDVLRARHGEINQPCHVQAYTIRTSWQRYIDENYGREALLAMNYPVAPPTDAYFVQLLGDGLATIDSLWSAWAVEKFNETPRAEEIAAAFRERVSWYTYCGY